MLECYRITSNIGNKGKYKISTFFVLLNFIPNISIALYVYKVAYHLKER